MSVAKRVIKFRFYIPLEDRTAALQRLRDFMTRIAKMYIPVTFYHTDDFEVKIKD